MAVTTLVWAVPRSLATTRGISDLIFFPPGTEMFQFSGFASFDDPASRDRVSPFGNLTDRRLFGTSPWLIAAYHVLLLLQEPRHPPYALCYFLGQNCSFKKIKLLEILGFSYFLSSICQRTLIYE